MIPFASIVSNAQQLASGRAAVVDCNIVVVVVAAPATAFDLRSTEQHRETFYAGIQTSNLELRDQYVTDSNGSLREYFACHVYFNKMQ